MRQYVNMKNESRKHHYVPQYLLRNFRPFEERNTVYVYDKKTGRSFESAIRKTGSENHFNCVEIKGKTVNFEEIFQRVDDLGSSLFRRILTSKSISDLEKERLEELAWIVCVQFLRTKIQRTTVLELTRQIAELLSRQGFAEQGIEDYTLFDENQARLTLFKTIFNTESFVSAILGKTPVILLNNMSNKNFWISDNPISLFNTFPYGQVGFDEKGIEIYFPISPQLCLGFFCPSIYIQLRESFSDFHPRPRLDNLYLERLYLGMRKSSPVIVTESEVDYLNELQVRSSSRFVYSNSNGFDLAEKILERIPSLKEVTTHKKLGNPGEWLPPSSNFPTGKYVVLHGLQNHHMLEVTELISEKIGFRFTTTDNTKLQMILMDQPLALAEGYVDGQSIGGLRDAKIEKIAICDALDEVQYRVKHTDEHLNNLLNKI